MTEKNAMPDWDILISFGMPLNTRREIYDLPGYDNVAANIINAARYLMQNRNEPYNGRYYDSFKALLLALKIHYPSEFRRIEYLSGMDLINVFELDNVSGRHIKLRNISLPLISRYYRQMRIR